MNLCNIWSKPMASCQSKNLASVCTTLNTNQQAHIKLSPPIEVLTTFQAEVDMSKQKAYWGVIWRSTSLGE